MLQVLKKHHEDAKGGILLSELSECIPEADKAAQVREREREREIDEIDVPVTR